MQQCWHDNPDQRPTFSQLQTQIDATLTTVAGYVDFLEIAPGVELATVLWLCVHVNYIYMHAQTIITDEWTADHIWSFKVK